MTQPIAPIASLAAAASTPLLLAHLLSVQLTVTAIRVRVSK